MVVKSAIALMDSVEERGWQNESRSEEMGGESLLSSTVAMDTKKADLLLYERFLNGKHAHTLKLLPS